MNGVMSYEQFLLYVNQFLEISNKIKDGWTLMGSWENAGHGYIKKCQITGDTKQLTSPVASAEEGIIEDYSVATFCDNDIPSECTEETKLTWEYHVVYSTSYEVPELFFNVWREDGVLLTLNEIWSRIPNRFGDRLRQNRWDFITQQEHPICRRPFFHLHPCQTSDILRSLRASRNLLVSWLSTVGCTVGLNIDLQYAFIT